jgi:hypothetical protein
VVRADVSGRVEHEQLDDAGVQLEPLSISTRYILGLR